MSKTINVIRNLPHVAHVDDERKDGSSIIVTLHDAWCFISDPGSGVMGFDTVSIAKVGTSKSSVYVQAIGPAVA